MSTEQQVNTTEQAPVLPADNMDFLDGQSSGGVQQQDNSGALYPNLQRRKESHPNCRGRSFVGGKWYWVSGWNNLQPNNTRYVSLSYTEMTPEEVSRYITNRPDSNTQATATTNAPAQTDAQVAKEAMTENTEKQDEIF